MTLGDPREIGTGAGHRRGFLDRWGPFALVLVLYVAIVVLKVQAERGLLPRFFKEESALQYRYARMVAEGTPIPEHDGRVQYPEGIWTRQALPLGMEYLTGLACRAWWLIRPGTALDDVLIVVKALVSTSSIFACYAACACLFGSGWSGLVAAILYGLSYASAYRSPQGFAHEDFALPLLFGGFAGLVAGLWGRGTTARTVGVLTAAALWTAALLTWHFSRFFLLAEIVALAALVLLGSSLTIRRLCVVLAVIVVSLVVGTALAEHLRATRFLASASFLGLVALLCSTGFLATRLRADTGGPRVRRAWDRLLGCLVPLALACVLAAVVNSTRSRYGHVGELLWAEIRHGGQKPADPAALSFDARVLWSGSFHGASLSWALWSMWAPWLAAGVTLGRAAGSPAWRADLARRDGLILLLANAVLFTAALFLAQRMAVFAVFFLAVLGGGSVADLAGRWSRTAATLVVLGLAILLVANNPWVDVGPRWLKIPPPRPRTSPAERYQPLNQVDASLFQWIRSRTPADAVFAGRFSALPPILAYGDRAIVLHSKFEVPGIRAKVQQHLRAAFGTEDELAAYCDAQGATHYLYDPFTALDAGVDSSRYIAGVTSLRKDSAAYLLHFAPERLHRFELEFQNGMYRVYRRTDHPAAFDGRRFAYQPIYDIGRFAGNEPGGAFFADASTDRVLIEQQAGNELLRRAIGLFILGRWEEALAGYDAALRINPSLPYAHSQRARILLQLGHLDEALAEARQATWVDPYEPEGYFHLAMAQSLLGDRDGVRESLLRCRQLDPHFPGVARALRRLRGSGP